MSDAAGTLGDILGTPPRLAALYGARERHFAVGDAHLDVGRVDIGIVGQTIAHVFADALVRAGVAFWPSAAMVLRPRIALPGILATTARGVVRTEPGGDFVAHALEKAAFATVARTAPILAAIAFTAVTLTAGAAAVGVAAPLVAAPGVEIAALVAAAGVVGRSAIGPVAIFAAPSAIVLVGAVEAAVVVAAEPAALLVPAGAEAAVLAPVAITVVVAAIAAAIAAAVSVTFRAAARSAAPSRNRP